MNRLSRIGHESTSRLLAEFSLPAVIAMVAQSACGIIDRVYAGNGAGTMAISGITVSFPVIALFMALGMLAGIGGSSLYSIRMGQGRISESSEVIRGSLFLLLLVPPVLAVTVFIFMEPVLKLCGAGAGSMAYARQYLGIMLLALPVQAAGFGMNNFIRAEGRPGIAMVTVMIASAGGLVLTPVFIFVLHLGLRGAAFSYLCAQVSACLWVARYFISGRVRDGKGIKPVLPRIGIIRDILRSGLGPFSIQVCAVAVASAYNHQLVRYGDSLSLSLFGILHCVSVFLLIPVLGINQGAQPLLGYNHGAGSERRVRNLLRETAGFSLALMLPGLLLVMLYPDFFISIFSHRDLLLARNGATALRIYTSLLPFAVLQICAATYFTSTGRPFHSVMLNCSRQVFFLLPLVVILPRFTGINGVWLAAPASDFAACMLSLFLLMKEGREAPRKRKINSAGEGVLCPLPLRR